MELARLPLPQIASEGYAFQVEMAWHATIAGAGIVEVPITFVERELGASKMSRDILVEALWRVTAWGVGERVGKVTGRPGIRAEPGWSRSRSARLSPGCEQRNMHGH